MVAESSDGGIGWKYHDIPRNGSRVQSLIKVGKRLFANTLFSEKDKISTTEYVNNIFIPRKKLNRDFFFPKTKFKEKKKIYIAKKLYLNNEKVLYIPFYGGTIHNPDTLGVYSLEEKWGRLLANKIKLPAGRVLDFVQYENKVFVLTDLMINSIYTTMVFSSKSSDLQSWKKEVSFQSRNIIRTFEVNKNNFYFGIGIELDENNQYFPKSVLTDVGDILKISR